MKRIVSTAFTLLMLSALAQAQDAQSHINKASENIKAKKYQEAIKNLNDAKKVVTDLISEQLSAALPQTVGGWKMSANSDNMSMMGMGGANEVSVNKMYKNEELEKKKQAEQASNTPDNLGDPGMMYGPMGGSPTVNITITNNMMNANDVMMAHSGENYNNGNPDEEFSALRIKGYRAALRYNKQYSNGSITIISGGGCVRIEVNGVSDKNILTQFAEAINYDTIKSILGE